MNLTYFEVKQNLGCYSPRLGASQWPKSCHPLATYFSLHSLLASIHSCDLSVGESPRHINFNKRGHPHGWCIQEVLEECIWNRATSRLDGATCLTELSYVVCFGLSVRRGIGSSKAQVQKCSPTSPVVFRRSSHQPSLWPSLRFFDPSSGARRMLMRWLYYNVLVHLDGNMNLDCSRFMLSYI
jgi:hypothetical protein